jgi:hypothetical protein
MKKLYTQGFLLKLAMPLFIVSNFQLIEVKAQQTVTVGTGTTNSYKYGPIYRSSSGSSYDFSHFGYVWTAAELGIPSGSTITAIQFNRSNSKSTGGSNNVFQIHMENSSATTVITGTNSYDTWIVGAELVYNNTSYNFAGSSGWYTINLSSSFVYTGGSLQMATKWDMSNGGTSNGAIKHYSNTANNMGEGDASSSLSSSDDFGSGTYDNKRPNIKITYVLDVAYTWVGSANDNNWNTAGNWDANATPTSTSNCIIPSGTCNIQTGGDCANLTVEAGAEFVIGDPGVTINVAGNYSDESGLTNVMGKLDITGTFDCTSGITIPGGGEIEVDGVSTIATGFGQFLEIAGGTFDANGNFNATGTTIHMDASSNIELAGTTNILGLLDETEGTVTYNGITQDVLADTYNNLVIKTSGTKTAQGNLNVGGNLTTEAAASCILDLSIYDLFITGNLTVGYRGGLDASDAACSVTFDGNSAVTHAGSYGSVLSSGQNLLTESYADLNNWTPVNVSGSASWSASSPGGSCTFSAYSGGSCAWIQLNSWTSAYDYIEYDLPAPQTGLSVSYYYINPSWSGDIDYLFVDYYNGTSWISQISHTSAHESWTSGSVSLPDGATKVRFYSVTNYGYGIGLDDVVITGDANAVISVDPTFNEIVVHSETGDITLASPVDVTTALTLTKGDIITTATNYLNAGSATITGGGNTSHVQGTLKRTLASNTAADFPVGNGALLKKVIITPSDATSRVWTITQANVVGVDQTVSGELDHVSPTNYWDISPSSAAANTLMQLTWGTNPGIDEADLSNIVLAHYNSAGYWEEIATTTSGGPSSGSISGTVSSFSPFSLGSKSSGNILPIDLISFTTNCNNDVVEVNFSVASQQNNDYFLVERSVDDIEWDEIGRLQGENESNNQKEYTILDFIPIKGLSYYRLTQVDYDGKFMTFSAVSNSCYTKETNLHIVVYPIPVVKKFTVEISIEDYQGSDVFYTITDLQGSVVLAKSVELNRGLNLLTMDIDHLSSGTYILSFNNTMNHIPNTKIIKR